MIFYIKMTFIFFIQSAALANSRDVLVKACESTDPVLIYDNFPLSAAEIQNTMIATKPVIDLNGDNIPEIYHGELVEKLVQLNGYSTVRFGMPGEWSLPEVAENLKSVVEKLESGKVRYSRINFSQETPLKISSFKKDLFPDDAHIPEITALNLPFYKDKILSKIMLDRPDFRLQEIIDLLKRLQKLEIPFIVAAGNSGPNFINVFSMLPGVTSVGALNLDGRKRPASADNSFVTIWKVGVFVSQLSTGGVDINNDQVTDFLSVNFSKGTVIPELLEGQLISEIVIPVPDEIKDYANTTLANSTLTVPNAAWNILPTGLYEVDELVQLGTITEGTKALWKSSGKYIYKSSLGRTLPFFFIDDGMRIRYDPLGSGAANQRSVLAGTSYAAPTICKMGQFADL